MVYLITRYETFYYGLCTLLIKTHVLFLLLCFYLQRDGGAGMLRLTSIRIHLCFLPDLFLSLVDWKLPVWFYQSVIILFL